MNTKGFMFDLDGVLVDTARYHFIAWQKIADELGIEFTPEHNEHLKGVSRSRSLDIILELGNIRAKAEDKEKWLRQKNEDYLGHIDNMDERDILPGVLNTLRYLKIKQQRMALGSSSKNARPILEKVKLLHSSTPSSTATMSQTPNPTRKCSFWRPGNSTWIPCTASYLKILSQGFRRPISPQ